MRDEDQLWLATRQYVKGEISVEELKAIEKPFHDDFNNAMKELAKRRVQWYWRR